MYDDKKLDKKKQLQSLRDGRNNNNNNNNNNILFILGKKHVNTRVAAS